MSTGAFINFNLPYSSGGIALSPDSQAEAILNEAAMRISQGAIGVAITYSANYGQTRTIRQAYFAGGWNTHTSGANQAAVMSCMESLLAGKYQTLQGKMRIAPITTMNAYSNPVMPWNDDVLMGIAITDLDRIDAYLNAGWTVLGWQNQGTINNPGHPYAIGGGIAALPMAVSDKIQHTLIAYSRAFPGK
jgi:hypothetical protein